MSQVKIGGFAAIIITMVAFGAIENITRTVVNRPVKPRKTPLKDRFWKEMAHKVEQYHKTPDIGGNDIREKIVADMAKLRELVIIECEDATEAENFDAAYSMKLDMLWKEEKSDE